MTEKKLDAALAEVVSSLKTAVETHGNDAVELALWSVQLNAIKHVATSALFFAVSVAVFIRFWNDLRRGAEDIFDPLPAVMSFITAFAAIVSFAGMAQPTKWLAAFGQPEILIAEKALKTAGLL